MKIHVSARFYHILAVYRAFNSNYYWLII